jgi:hypothetical protein
MRYDKQLGRKLLPTDISNIAYLMKIPDSRPKVLAFREMISHTRRALTSPRADIVTPPIQAHLSPLQSKEDYDSGDSNCGRKCSRENVVIL